jgi:hypothetical protein
VRNLQRAHRLNSRRQRHVGLAAASAARELSPGFSQDSKDLRPVESLPRTMLAKSHRSPCLV